MFIIPNENFFETKVFYDDIVFRFSKVQTNRFKKEKNPPKFENLFYGPTSRATVKT